MDELIVILLILLVVTPFICMIVTLVTASRVSATIRDAEHRWRKRLAGMEQPTKTGQPPAVVAPPPRPPVSSAAPVPPPVRKREPMEPKKVEAEERPLETPASVFPPPSPKPKEPAREPEKPAAPASVPVVARAKSDAPALSLEERIGGRWFNWVGILAMLFGVAYGLKYSFDQGWVTPTMRFWGGLTLGVALLAAGVVSERRGYAVLAHGFWGGGTGTLFLVFYAGFQLLTGPEGAPVIARGVAFAGMALTVVVGVSIAVVYNARSTAVLSAVGGYLTPLLLGNFARDQVFLFTYLSILTAGLLVLGYWKRWVFLRPLAFGAIVAYFAGWWWTNGVGLPWAMLLYTSLLFMLFSADLVAWSGWRRVRESPASYVLLGLNTTLHVCVGLSVLARHFPAWQGLFLLLGAGFHLIGAWTLLRRHPEDGPLRIVLVHLAGAMFLLAPVFEPRAALHWLPICWALQGAALVVASGRWGGIEVRAWGIFALGAAAVRLFSSGELVDVDPYLPFWSARALAYGVVTGAFAVACWRIRGGTARERQVVTWLWIVALSVPAVFLSLELAQGLDTYVAPKFGTATSAYEHQSGHFMTLLWVAYATLVVSVARRRAARTLVVTALAFGCVVFVKYIFADLLTNYVTQATPLFNSRLLVTAAMAGCMFWLARDNKELARLSHVAHVVLAAGLCMEWVDFCGYREIDTGFMRGAALGGLGLIGSAYGAALVWFDRARLGLAFLVATATAWLTIILPLAGFGGAFLLTIRFLAAAALCAACFWAARGWRLRLLAHAVVLATMSVEVVDLFSRHRLGPLSVVHEGGFALVAFWAAYGMGALICGHRLQRRHLRGLGLLVVCVPVAACLMMLLGAEGADKLILNTRMLGLTATVAALLAASELYRRPGLALDKPLRLQSTDEDKRLGPPFALLGHGLAMLALTLEASDYFQRGGLALGAEWIDWRNLQQLSISFLWAAYAIGLVIAGLRRRFRPVRLLALGVLGVTIFKVFLFDLSFLKNPYRMFSFLVLGAILVGVSFLYQKYRAYLV